MARRITVGRFLLYGPSSPPPPPPRSRISSNPRMRYLLSPPLRRRCFKRPTMISPHRSPNPYIRRAPTPPPVPSRMSSASPPTSSPSALATAMASPTIIRDLLTSFSPAADFFISPLATAASRSGKPFAATSRPSLPTSWRSSRVH